MKQVLAKVAEGMDLTSAELEAAMGGSRCWSCFRSAGDGPASRPQNEGGKLLKNGRLLQK